MGAAFTPGGTRLTAYPMVTIGSDGQISRSGPVFLEYRGCDCRLVPWRNLERMRKESLALYSIMETIRDAAADALLDGELEGFAQETIKRCQAALRAARGEEPQQP